MGKNNKIKASKEITRPISNDRFHTDNTLRRSLKDSFIRAFISSRRCCWCSIHFFLLMSCLYILLLLSPATWSAMQRPTSLDDNDICLVFPHFLLFGKSRWNLGRAFVRTGLIANWLAKRENLIIFAWRITQRQGTSRSKWFKVFLEICHASRSRRRN